VKRIAAIVVAVLLASCGGAPGVTVSIASVRVPMVRSSSTEGTPCSTSHGDAFPQDVPLTTVRTSTPVTLRFVAGKGATQIRVVIYDIDAPTLSGGPIEEFTLSGGSGDRQVPSIVPARTYRVLVNVVWSFLITRGEETHVFRLRVEPP
jgi:hypothetical protein